MKFLVENCSRLVQTSFSFFAKMKSNKKNDENFILFELDKRYWPVPKYKKSQGHSDGTVYGHL